MKKISITIKAVPAHTYDIIIGEGLLSKVSELIDIKAYSKAAIITDTKIAVHFLESVQKAIAIPNIAVILEPGEPHKTIESTQKIWIELKEATFDRKSLIINLGGGVIGDIGGFAASTYMRGIDFINIPTTVLAQVDESVGGKTGINFAGVKNLIGTFEQPKAVLIDVDTLKTLPDREFISGFAEIIKHGIIADKVYFEKVTSKHPRDFSQDELTDIIARSCEIKRAIVENDEKETGLRRLVNFGHTIGHAIEALSLETENHLLHGEAVSIGMVAEAKLSELKNHITSDHVTSIKKSLEHAGLPTSLKNVDNNKIIEKIKSDKKVIAGSVKWTLLAEMGKAVFDEEVEGPLVDQAIDFITQ